MPPEKDASGRLTVLHSVADLAGKAIFGTVGLCLAVGILVVSLHLASLGIADSGFLKSQYVAAGAVCVLLHCAGAVFWLAVLFVGKHAKRDFSERRYLRPIPLLFLPLSFGVLTVGLVAVFRGDLEWLRYQTTWTAAVVISLCAVPIIVVAALARDFWRNQALKSSDWWRTFLAMIVILGGFLTMGWPLSAYTRYVYPILAQGYGGGRPVTAKIILKPEAFNDRPDMRRLLAGNCEILSETGEWIVVRPRRHARVTNKHTIVRVKRDFVAAVVRELPAP